MACRSIAEAALYRVLLSCQGQERRRLGIGREQKRRLRDAGDREGGRRRRMSGVVVEGEGEAEKGQEKDHDLTGRREKPQGSSMAVEVQRRDIAAEEEVSGYGKMKGNSGWNLEGEHLGEDENKEVVSVELRRGGMEEEEEEEEEEEGDEEEEGSRGGMVTLRKALEGKERGTPRNTSKRDFGERERGEERRNPSPAGFDCYSADGAGNRRGSLVEGSCDWSPCASQQKPLFLPDLRDASPYIHSHGSDAEISYCHSSHEKGSSRFKSHETPPHAWQLHPHTQNHLHSPFCPLSLAPHQPSYRSSLRTCRRASSRASRRTSLDNELFVQGEEEEEEGEEEEEQEEGKEGEERQEDDLLVLRRALEHETELSDSLRRELEQERAAADSAAQASMDLIHQLQQDKASAQRAAGSAAQRERILEQKVLSDKEEMEELRAVLESQEEEVGLLRRLLEQKQEEVRALEAELALWRGHVAGADWLAEVEEDGAEEGSVEEGSVEEGSVEEGSVEEGSVGEGSCLVGVEDLDAPLLGEESGSGGRDEAGLGVEGIEEGGDEKEVRQGEE
ncbi:hypothetical protein CLOM_g4315 [Closterium sp. NIES-68]|nr:hypothetical protein CLOM_g4315 [Closterium sp. NIES-68]GJP75994.1 hypothetical protein CLOP_g6391 [Closterium sp. NIES-67]